MSDPLSRRDFLRRAGGGAAALVASGYVLRTWERAAPAAADVATPAAGTLPSIPGRTLVVLELSGGNDGLNTLVPHADPAYHQLRPTLGVTEPIDLDGQVGLHPSLTRLAARYHAGQVAVVEGLGYTPPDLSHFGSLEVWWTAQRPDGSPGWLGSYLDATVGYEDPLAAIGLGGQPAPALLGQQSFATTIDDASGLQPRPPRWTGSTDTLVSSWSGFAPARIDTRPLVGQVERAVSLTAKARDRLDQVLSPSAAPTPRSQAGGAYTASTVVDSLTLAAQLIKSPLAPRVVYVNGVGDFDVHEGEAQRQPALLSDVDQGIEALFTGLGSAADGVVLMTTSEFGRRVAENGSGTDHGTANVHFLVGPHVKGGRYGEPPSLTQLDANGNLVPSIDFRSHLATGLGWLGVTDTHPVLGASFSPVPALT
ncbi:MAG TPA: DUF1501 domain-containing protein [Acidimicrobiia bacterium]|jgi:uncharacterized protein (DUF1501 family)